MDETRNPAPRRLSARRRQRLALGGLAAAATVSLSACDSKPDFSDAQFTTVSECVRGGFPDDLCQSSYNAALQQYQSDAPKFNTLKDCEAQWGEQQCGPGVAYGSSYTNNSSGSVFMPLLAGFVVSQALQRRYNEYGGVGYYGGYGGSYRGSPIYRDRSGSTVTIDRRGGQSIAKPVNVNTTTVARSGFGGMGKSRSSGWGG
jgi:uncharacterized protein YgiB involved in biofilm formation